jgi:hypothetical protein
MHLTTKYVVVEFWLVMGWDLVAMLFLVISNILPSLLENQLSEKAILVVKWQPSQIFLS